MITLISFAFSVGGTRLFLEVLGYPQLGGGQLHIAHVLWGGLFLFVASLLPLILINRWGLRLSALLAGFGIGLFIDEVGKFITQTNDYFYPAAAPISSSRMDPFSAISSRPFLAVWAPEKAPFS